MGHKSRENWNIGICLKEDCVHRDFKCKDCIRFSNYDNKKFFDSLAELDKIIKEANEGE